MPLEVITVETETLTVDVAIEAAGPSAIDVVVDQPGPVSVEVVTGGGGLVDYTQLPQELLYIPISFPFSGKPTPATIVNVPMGFSLRVPAGLAGTVTYARVKATTDTAFSLYRIVGEAMPIPLGTITLTPESTTSNRLTGLGGELLAGEVMQLVVSGVPDETLADVGITILAGRE
jgi:hypothetical protein